VVSKIVIDPLDELSFRKPVRQHVREFGALIGVIVLLAACYIAWREGSLATVGGLTLTALAIYGVGAKAPRMLLGVWRGWMRFAEALGVVMTTLILGIGWLFLMLPTSLALRVFRIKVMDTTFRSPVSSYWEDRDPKMDDFKLLERQF
jgi:hypothetical protein